MSPWFIFVGFGIIVGIYGVVHLRRKENVVGARLTLALSLALILWGVFGGMIMRSASDKVGEIWKPEPRRIVALELHPFKQHRGIHTLVDLPIRVTDRAIIKRISKLLRTGRRWAPNHPQILWKSYLTLDYGDHKTTAVASSTTNNGDLVVVHSKKGSGWLLMEIRADGLGAELEALARRQKKGTPK